MSSEATASFERRHPRALALIRAGSWLIAALLLLEILVRVGTYVAWRRGLSEFEDIRRRHDASRALYPVMNIGVLLGDPGGFPGIIPAADGPPRVQSFAAIDGSAFLEGLPTGPPAAQRARVVFAGGSTTYDGYPAVVAARLGTRIEAINLGIPASNSATSLVLLRRFLPQLRPRAVVVYHGFNDIAYYRARARAAERRARGAEDSEPAMFVQRPSRGVLEVLFARALDELPADAIAGSTHNYEQMAALARELDFKLFISTFAAPSYDEVDATARRFFEADLRYLWPMLAPVDRYRSDLAAYNENVRRVAPRIGAQLIEVAATVHGGRNLFRDNCHTTVEGRTIHASAVADALTPLLGPANP